MKEYKNNKWLAILKVVAILVVFLFIIKIFSGNDPVRENIESNPSELTEKKNDDSENIVSKADPAKESEMYTIIKRNYSNKNFLDLQLRAEDFYKNFKMSDKMDSVEVMYEVALDSLEAVELREEGSLAFKRYKLHENPILNPNPAMSAPVDNYLQRFVGKGSDFAELVKNKLNEPNSFEYLETKYMNKKSGYIALVMRFKAKNGLGLIVEREALGKFDKVSETFHDIKIRD